MLCQFICHWSITFTTYVSLFLIGLLYIIYFVCKLIVHWSTTFNSYVSLSFIPIQHLLLMQAYRSLVYNLYVLCKLVSHWSSSTFLHVNSRKDAFCQGRKKKPSLLIPCNHCVLPPTPLSFTTSTQLDF